jgi:hypothetical protein
VAVAPSPARALQQRLGNHGAQRFGAQVVARSSAPGGSVGGGTSAGTFSLSAPDDASEREADRVADAVMRTTERGSASPSPSALTVQRACADCEEEMSKRARAAQPVAAGDAPEVHRSASSAEASQVSAPVAASIHDMQGGGAPLADATRALFEPRFGADFSRVRVHTDAHAARTASSINAKAFTVGRDVAFAAGKYAPHSGEGQRLLAHELTHVIQQSGTSASTVQRDDEPGAQPGRDEPEDKPLFVPEAVVLELLHLLELEAFAGSAEEFEEEPAAAPSDAEQLFQEALDDATAWLGHGASADRKILLLRTEDVRLQKNAVYKETVIGQFATEQYPDQQYLAWLMDTYDPISSTEQGTLSRLNENMQLALTPSSFIDNLEIQRWEGANAFPDYAWNIVQPLISPSEGLRTSVASSRSATETRLIASWGALGLDLAAHGIPASYMRSLSISHYSAVKSKAVPKLLKMPDRAWIYEHFVLPEETALHSAVMKEYTENLTSYVLASLQHSVLEKWAAASAFRWPYFDTYAISVFRNTYTSGLGSVEDFYNYAQIGLGQAAAVTAARLDAQIPSSGANPFLVLIRLSTEAQGLGPKILTQLNAAELQNFKNTLEHADSKLARLPEASRLMTAVDWSIKKGFAGEGILALLDNLDTILLELLKDFAKEKAVKKAISAIGVFGGPWGRAISLLYNIWELLDDVRDKVEMALLIKSFLDIVDMAKQSETIVTTQQASAKLAQAYASTFQILIQRLGAKLLAKLSAKAAKRLGEKWKKGDRMSDAEQAENIAVSQKVDDARNLEPQYLHAEVKTALKAPARKSSDADYDAEVAVGNNHVYRRLRGTNIWCRSTDKCVVPKLDPELTKELNDKADKEVPSAQSGESQRPVAAFEPGKAPKSPEQITRASSRPGSSPIGPRTRRPPATLSSRRALSPSQASGRPPPTGSRPKWPWSHIPRRTPRSSP